MNTKKEKCKCGKMAVWCYMPGYGDNSSSYHCDDCVPRGCSCNVNFIDNLEKEENYKDGDKVLFLNESHDFFNEKVGCSKEEATHYEILDEQGRREPCIEYWYDEEGFDIDENFKDI